MNPKIFSGLGNIREAIHTHPLWYLDKTVVLLLDNYFTKSAEKQEHNEEWRKARREVVKVFADALENGQIFLGDAPEGFNDDDRWCPMNWDSERGAGISFLNLKDNPKVEKDHPDTVVVHHSSTAEDVWEIEVLSLLWLYVPLCRSKVFNDNGEYVPVSSGYYRDGRQTFIGYHYLVYPDGMVDQTLKDSYMGFHAGDLKVNQRSVGICLVR